MNIYMNAICDKQIAGIVCLSIERMNLLTADGKNIPLSHVYAEHQVSDGSATWKLEGTNKNSQYLNENAEKLMKGACLAVRLSIDVYENEENEYERDELTPEQEKVCDELLSSVHFQPAKVENGDETYEIPVYNVAHYTIECCPWCEAEEVIFAKGVTACPDCGKPLAPAACVIAATMTPVHTAATEAKVMSAKR